MRVALRHKFDVSLQEAIAIQESLKPGLKFKNIFNPAEVKLICGADISYSRGSNKIFATLVVISFPDLKTIEESWAFKEAAFPYIPGLLAFREGPALLNAFERLGCQPDLLMFDGHGISHPRGFGIASHMGVLLEKPSIGVAKTRLCGKESQPNFNKGSTAPLLDSQGREIGALVRTRDRVKPVYVSIGHGIDLPTAVEFALKTSPKFRLPEPLRRAHLLAHKKRTEADFA